MPLGRKPDPDAPFDPLARSVVPRSITAIGRYARGRRLARLAHAKKMAEHLRLTDQGRIPEAEYARNQGAHGRDDYDAKLRHYPEMPEAVLTTLVDILTRYGLPLEALPSDTAAFVLRRVLLDYRYMALLQRQDRPAMFTVDELIELMRVLGTNQHQLADLLAPHGSPQDKYGIYVMIQRWVQGVNRPWGLTAHRVNQLINQYVRRKRVTTNASIKDEAKLSHHPETERRRADKRRQAEAEQRRLNVPISRAAKREGSGGE
jgi:hypothetical protein